MKEPSNILLHIHIYCITYIFYISYCFKKSQELEFLLKSIQEINEMLCILNAIEF